MPMLKRGVYFGNSKETWKIRAQLIVKYRFFCEIFINEKEVRNVNQGKKVMFSPTRQIVLTRQFFPFFSNFKIMIHEFYHKCVVLLLLKWSLVRVQNLIPFSIHHQKQATKKQKQKHNWQFQKRFNNNKNNFTAFFHHHGFDMVYKRFQLEGCRYQAWILNRLRPNILWNVLFMP